MGKERDSLPESVLWQTGLYIPCRDQRCKFYRIDPPWYQLAHIYIYKNIIIIFMYTSLPHSPIPVCMTVFLCFPVYIPYGLKFLYISKSSFTVLVPFPLSLLVCFCKMSHKLSWAGCSWQVTKKFDWLIDWLLTLICVNVWTTPMCGTKDLLFSA